MSESASRIVVLIDGQNIYKDARRAFLDDPDDAVASAGQVAPRRYAELLIERSSVHHPRELKSVAVYCGIPGRKQQPTAHAAYQRMREEWVTNRVDVFDRPLRYPKDWPDSPATEKGIDVALAVDLVYGAAKSLYDVAIVASTDTDLLPALEAVCNLHRAWGRPKVEVAAWQPTTSTPRKRLSVRDHNVWCHWLTEDDYLAVRDPTNYTLPRKETRHREEG
jgi:uncharacterized LabA/DUF88 family protein